MPTEKSKGGYVYLMQNTETLKYKIGFTNNLKRRLQKAQTDNHAEIKYINWVMVNDKRRVEKEVHSRFKYSRRRGEWFVLSDEQVEAVQSLFEKIHWREKHERNLDRFF